VLRRHYKDVMIGQDEKSGPPLDHSTPRTQAATLAGMGSGLDASGQATGYSGVSGYGAQTGYSRYASTSHDVPGYQSGNTQSTYGQYSSGSTPGSALYPLSAAASYQSSSSMNPTYSSYGPVVTSSWPSSAGPSTTGNYAAASPYTQSYGTIPETPNIYSNYPSPASSQLQATDLYGPAGQYNEQSHVQSTEEEIYLPTPEEVSQSRSHGEGDHHRKHRRR